MLFLQQQNYKIKMNNIPSPHNKYPIENQTSLVYLKNIIKNPNIIVGDYTYYHDFKNPENFEKAVRPR